MNIISNKEIKMTFERMGLGTKKQREYFLNLNEWDNDPNGIINYSEISTDDQFEKIKKEIFNA